MLFFDILIWMAVAKIAVLLLEDTAYAVRGKQSPRQRERAAHRAAETAGQPSPRTTGTRGRVRSAVGGYLAGVAEDATAKARARKRRAQAHQRGDQAVDGVFVDLTDDDGFHADCDVCGWSSRPYRIEANALAAGREHTRTEHPDLYHPDPQPQPTQPQPAQSDPADSMTVAQSTDPAEGTDPAAGSVPVEAPQGRPALRVIPGGRADESPAEPASSVVHDDHTYCLAPKCPVCRPGAGAHGWSCDTCGGRREGFGSEAAARADAAGHSCTPRNTPQKPAPAAGVWRCPYPVTRSDSDRCGDRTRDGLRYCDAHLAVIDAEGLHRCMVADPDHGHGVCGLYTVPGTDFCIHHQGSDLPVTAIPADDPRWRCPYPSADGPCGAAPQWNARYCYRHDGLAQDDLMNLADATTQSSAAGNPAGSGKERSTTVNLDATGPEEIRAAFATGVEVAGEKAEEMAGLAGVLVEAADRFENLQMAASTVEHMREAAEALQAAKALLDNAQESLTNALADFNSKDGQVADTVADAGGNLASQDVLVGG